MKILMMNKYFYLKGGAEKYFFELQDLLKRNGHDIVPFCMESERNLPTPHSRYFVPHVDYGGAMNPLSKIRAAARTIHYPEAERRAEALICETRPDIVHVHNIYHQLTYAPLRAAKRHGIPVVMTAHDLKLVCPNYQMFCRGQVCEKCSGGRYYNALRRRCGKGRLSDSLILACEMYYNRRIHDAVRYMDAIICPSRFLRDKLEAHGIPAAKLVHVPNCLDLADYAPRYGCDEEGYAVYAGRLNAEKGLHTLLGAMRLLPGMTLKIAGEGPERQALQIAAKKWGLSGVAFLGYLEGGALHEAIRDAGFVVAPSECYENFPYAVLEAFALGKPVVASRIGGIPELVESGVNGYLFAPGNSEELAQRMEELALDPLRLREFGRNGRSLVENLCGPERHYEAILEIYQCLLEKKPLPPEKGPDHG